MDAPETHSNLLLTRNSAKKLTVKEKSTLIYIIYFQCLLAGTLYMNVLTFYPLYVLDNYGDKVSTTMTSVALGCFEFSTLVFAPTHMYTSSYLGRKKGLLLGIFCMLIANTGLGALSLFPREEAYGIPFFWMTSLIRLISGFGDSLTVLICFSLIGSQFPKDKDVYMGMAEAYFGIGFAIGPAIGSFMYGTFGFAWAFYVFSIIMAIDFCVVLLLVSSKLSASTTT